jgi:CheY-like chemotaxis protein
VSQKRILVIDDDQDIREALLDVLGDAGYSVALAATATEALALLARDEPPSLILIDLKMPGMDAFAFRAAQARDPRIASVPVLVISASGNLPETAELLGAAGYIAKPMKLDVLLGELQRRCGPSSAGSPGESSS